MSSVVQDLKVVEDRLVARIQELEKNLEELEELREIAQRLGISPSTTPRRATRTTPSRRGPSRGTRGGARVTRRERVIELVGRQPGITITELVERMQVNRTSLYPVIRQLVSDGLINKDGTHLTPRG